MKLDSSYKIGQKVQARVLYDLVSTSPPQFALSVAEHIISLQEKGVRSIVEGADQPLRHAFPIGTILQDARVIRVEPERGLIIDFEQSVQGHVHVR